LIEQLYDLAPNALEGILSNVKMLKGHEIKFKRKLEEMKKYGG